MRPAEFAACAGALGQVARSFILAVVTRGDSGGRRSRGRGAHLADGDGAALEGGRSGGERGVGSARVRRGGGARGGWVACARKKEIGSLPAHPGWPAGTPRGGDAEGRSARVPRARRRVGKGRRARARGARGARVGRARARVRPRDVDLRMLTRGRGNGADPASKSSAIARGAARGEGSNLDGLGRGDALADEGGGGEHGGHGVVFVRGATACVRLCTPNPRFNRDGPRQGGRSASSAGPRSSSRSPIGRASLCTLGTRSPPLHTFGRARREDGARSRWSRRPRRRRRR